MERELGEGGMAIVFLAHDFRHDRAVAVKVLRPELAAFLGADRFLREIHIAAQLNHPHVLPLHDSGEADGLLYYVMPYVEGESLRERLLRERQLPLEEALRIASEVADGLAYAHQLGVVHRDVKPENILLSHGHATIADFGIARAVAGAGGVTTTGSALGTPLYMSPEQASGSLDLDHRADTYSLGCVLYEMLAGEPPFSGPTSQAVMAKHLTDPVPSIRARRPDVPLRIEAAIRTAMAKQPAERFGTVGALGAALAAGGPWPTGELRALSRDLAGHRARLAAAAAFLTVAALVAWRLWPPPRPPTVSLPLKVAVPYFDATAEGLRGLADRVTEALTDRLQPIPALAVTSSAALLPLRGAPLDTILARFRPDRLITGTVEPFGDRVRVTVRIVDGSTGRQLAAYMDSAASPDLPADALADGLSRFIRSAFAAELDLANQRARVRDADAWALVGQARQAMEEADDAILNQLDRTGFVAVERADSLLRLAWARDTRSTLIPILVAKNADRKAFFAEFLRQVAPESFRTLPDPLAVRAGAVALMDSLLREHPTTADAFALRGSIKAGLFRVGGTDSLLEAAIADLERAKSLDPRLASAWNELASAYLDAGRYGEALFGYERALRVDAFQRQREDYLRGSFEAALLAEKYADAEAACRAGQREFPGDQQFRGCELALLSRTARDARAAARAVAIADSLATIEEHPLLRAKGELYAAATLALAGQGAQADRMAARAVAPYPGQALLQLELAWVRLQRSDPDSALTLLASAARSDPTTRRYIRYAPWFQSLRSDPRFAEAVSGSRPTSNPRGQPASRP
ncbi:MAG: protein kinase [Gemmatimonadota bacterium]